MKTAAELDAFQRKANLERDARINAYVIALADFAILEGRNRRMADSEILAGGMEYLATIVSFMARRHTNPTKSCDDAIIMFSEYVKALLGRIK